VKNWILITIFLACFYAGKGQNARVVLVNHELRWASESRFPNYFLDQHIRDSVFSDTRIELMKMLQTKDVTFPDGVKYKIINGFGNQKVEMPGASSGTDTEIAIFSFITRGTVGFAVFWKLNILIRRGGQMVWAKEVVHELEYYDASGYFSSRRWLSPEEFRSVFGRLVKEALGTLPESDEKILLGSPEKKEQLVKSLFPDSQRMLLKIRGEWMTAGNFAALIESGSDTLARLDYREGWETESVSVSGPALFAALFTEITGIDVAYQQKVVREKKGTMRFPDGKKTKVRLSWIEFQERTVKDEEGTTRITEPLVTRLYDEGSKTGEFLYTSRERVHFTDQTKTKFNIFTGYQDENTLGTEFTHRIEGYWGDTPIFAEMNEFHGIIEVAADSVLIAMMVVQNVNPDSHSFGKAKLAKNKKFVTSSSAVGKQSLDKAEKVEWYPLYLRTGATAEVGELCMKILSCLFNGMGNAVQPEIIQE